jgi:uncharacterized protein YjbJ (UPF0337 family)
VLKEKKWRNGASQLRSGNEVNTQSNLITRREGKVLKPSTKDKAEGKIHEVKGEIKEEVGKVTNDPDLEVSGAAEKNAGKVQKWISRAEKAVGE